MIGINNRNEKRSLLFKSYLIVCQNHFSGKVETLNVSLVDTFFLRLLHYMILINGFFGKSKLFYSCLYLGEH